MGTHVCIVMLTGMNVSSTIIGFALLRLCSTTARLIIAALMNCGRATTMVKIFIMTYSTGETLWSFSSLPFSIWYRLPHSRHFPSMLWKSMRLPQTHIHPLIFAGLPATMA